MIRLFSSAKFWKVLMFVKPYKRFPLSVIYIAVFALCWFASILNAEYDWHIASSSFKIALVFLASAMFASIGMTKLASIVEDKRKAMIWNVATQVFLVFEWAYMYWQDSLHILHISTPYALVLTSIVSIALLPVIGKCKDRVLWNNVKKLFLGLLISVCRAVGVSLCLLIVFFLLYIPLNMMTDLKCPTLLLQVIGLILPFVFCMLDFLRREHIGKKLISFKEKESVFQGYHKMPLGLFAYAILVMYLYMLIIACSFELPRGYISLICSTLTAFGLLCYILLANTKFNEAGKIWKGIYSHIPLLLLPLQILITIAIGRRINDYGVTISRCYIVLLNLWSYAICIYLIMRKGNNNNLRWIPISFILTYFVFTATPLSCSNYVLWQLKTDIRAFQSHKQSIFNRGIPEDKYDYLIQEYGYDTVKELAKKMPRDTISSTAKKL